MPHAAGASSVWAAALWALCWKIGKGQIQGGDGIGVFHSHGTVYPLLEIYRSASGTAMLNYHQWTATVSYQLQRCEFGSALKLGTQKLHLILVFGISLPRDLRGVVSPFYASFSLAVR